MNRKPKIHYLMISFQWNFLAETALRSLPAHVHPFLIHNGKSEKQAEIFKRSRSLSGEWIVYESRHGQVLDRIWQDPHFYSIRECDVLICIDHDCFFGPRFEAVERRITDAVMRGAIIAAHKHPYQRFATWFMFGLKPVSHWPATWHAAPLPDGSGRVDTGQLIAHMLPKGSIEILAGSKFAMHWGNDWQWRNATASRNPWGPILKNLSTHYEKLLLSGLWSPSEEELRDMESHVLLVPAVRSYEAMRQAS